MKVLLVAIAKNESAYLPHWIHHHLEFGFDAITILLNNTDDHSELVLKKIIKKYPQVDYSYCDAYSDRTKSFEFDKYIDWNFLNNNPMQSRAFSSTFLKAKNENFDYVAFLDVDEFFVNYKGFSVSDWISSIQRPDLIKIKCFNKTGSVSEFASPIKEVNHGVKSNLTKCVLSTKCENILFKTTHQIQVHSSSFRFLAGYGDLSKRIPNKIDDSWSSEVCIMHDYLRSQKEYLATLYRGDTISNTFMGLKENRPGWSSNENKDVVSVYSDTVKKLNDSYINFVIDLDLKPLLEVSKHLVADRAKRAISLRDKIKAMNKSVDKIFKGVDWCE